MHYDKIAVIIPCYNEEKSIIAVIDEVHSVLPNAEIYVFDNNSTDKSSTLVQAKIAELSHLNGGGGEFCALSVIANEQSERGNLVNSMDCHEFANANSRNDDDFTNNPNSSKLHLMSVPTQGKGAVIAYAFSVIETQIYVMIDADLECDVSILPKALQVFAKENLDMLNIARLSTSANDYRKGHKFGNTLFTKIAQMLFGKKFKDLLSGYRIFSRPFVKSFPASSKGFEIETELSVFALQCGSRVGEIEALYRSRLQGSFSKLHTFKDGFKILFMIFQLLFTERPLFVFGLVSAFCFVLSLVLGVPIVVEFIQTSQVARFPTLFVCVGLMIISVVLGIAGLLAHLVARNCKEMRRFFYLLNKTSTFVCHIERSEISQNRDSSPLAQNDKS